MWGEGRERERMRISHFIRGEKIARQQMEEKLDKERVKIEGEVKVLKTTISINGHNGALRDEMNQKLSEYKLLSYFKQTGLMY